MTASGSGEPMEATTRVVYGSGTALRVRDQVLGTTDHEKFCAKESVVALAVRKGLAAAALDRRNVNDVNAPIDRCDPTNPRARCSCRRVFRPPCVLASAEF